MAGGTGRRIGRWIVGLIVIALAAGGGWWAARATLTTPEQTQTVQQEQILATVTNASVGKSYNYNVTVNQPLSLVAANALSGVVTQAFGGGTVNQGDVVYSVANQPVRVCVGTIPFYRDLVQGAKGEDVRQFQQLLADLGYAITVDGDFGARTTAVVKQWQKDLGEERTGIVQLGRLIAVQSLPATVTLGEDIKVGHVLAGGEDGVLAHFGDPEFVMQLSSDQANLVPADATINVILDDATIWPAVIKETRTAEYGGVELVLQAPDGGLVCGADCGRIPADEKVQLRSRVQVVPEMSGPGVPAAAVRTDGTGAQYVLLPDGTQQPVTVLASGDGIAIVDGLTEGQQVVVLQASSTPGSSGTGGTTGTTGNQTSTPAPPTEAPPPTDATPTSTEG